MSQNNRVQLTGNLGIAPESKTFESGSRRTSFTLATHENFTNRNGENETRVDWHFVTAWGKLAEKIEKEFQKGSFVSIDGRLSSRSYIDKNGQKRYITEVVANEATLINKAAEKTVAASE
jgi:single-strand DNA-binding protein